MSRARHVKFCETCNGECEFPPQLYIQNQDHNLHVVVRRTANEHGWSTSYYLMRLLVADLQRRGELSEAQASELLARA